MEKKLIADYIAFDHQVPCESTSSQRKKKEEKIKFQELSSSYENWKNKGNNGNDKKTSKLFFNKTHLKL